MNNQSYNYISKKIDELLDIIKNDETHPLVSALNLLLDIIEKADTEEF